ncbi:MAG TPA: SpoIIE family protein phosphatase [Mycobacteriales bacterium]|nr:SpoIIE family protein phosphatase [Mycobacteriales bacterium]
MSDDIPDGMRALFAAAGTTGASMLTVDWAASPLGPVSDWPQSLRTAVSIVLSSRHPLLIWWGPQLVMLYNDALAPSFGDKHPHAVGRPGAAMFAEMWDVIGPMLHSVLDTGEATWRYDEPLPMDRRGFLEDTYWTYSYSPILDEAGGVAGVFTATSETTDRVLRERRLQVLHRQAGATDGARTTRQLCELTIQALGQDRSDVAFAGIYVMDSAGDAVLVARTENGPPLPAMLPAGDPASDWSVHQALAERRLLIAGQPGDPSTHASAVVPILPPGGTGPPGALIAGIVPTINFDADYEQFLVALGDRVGVAITEVEAYTAERSRAESLAALNVARIEAASREHQIADELQRTLLPAALGTPPGLEVAAHYRAGVQGTRVGGDWYDVIDLDRGRTGLVIGDVMGRGVKAAAIMGQIRTAIRAYAKLDFEPARVLNLVDGLVRGMAEDHIATCIYAIYDAADNSLHLANAGHPPPLVVSPTGTTRLAFGAGPPLGTGVPNAVEARVSLTPGAVLALYTDGLVEQRGLDIDEGVAALQCLLSSKQGLTGPLVNLPAEMVSALRPGGVAEDDDIALLLVRVRTQEDGPPGEDDGKHVLSLAAEPLSARTARRFVRDILDRAGRHDWQDEAQLAVSEIVTNAVLHAHTPIQLSVTLGPTRLLVEVRDENPSLPAARSHADDATTGRGMGLVTASVSEFGVEVGDVNGKTVWFVMGEPTERVQDPPGPPSGSLLQQTRTPLAGDDCPIRLLKLPATLWLAAQPQHQAMLRELALVNGASAAPPALVLAEQASRLISEALDSALDQARRLGISSTPLPESHPSTLPAVPTDLDLELTVPVTSGLSFAALQDQLDEAGRLARAGRMLARPCLPEIVALRDWACEQVIAQLGGGSPSAWPGSDEDRFVTDVDPHVAANAGWGLDAVREATRGAIAADDANRIIAVSRPLADRLGWDPSDLVGRRVVAIVPPRFREAHVAGFTRHLTTGQAHALGVDLQLPVLCRDGSELTCNFFIEAQATPTGRTVYVAWITPPALMSARD